MPDSRAKAKKRAAEKVTAAPAKKSASRWWICAAAAVAVYAVFLVYSPALNGPYIFDDSSLPYHSVNFSNDLSAWLGGVRPLLMLSYWVNYQVSQDPQGFHITNVCIHLLNGLLIFFIVKKMQPGLLLPAFAAAVFLLHPIQTESVSYIAGRSESLSVLFFLAAFAVFLYRRSPAISWQTAIAILALFAAAVATKEHTLVLPALLLLTDYYWNPGFSFSGIRRNWRLYVPIAIGALGASPSSPGYWRAPAAVPASGSRTSPGTNTSSLNAAPFSSTCGSWCSPPAKTWIGTISYRATFSIGAPSSDSWRSWRW